MHPFLSLLESYTLLLNEMDIKKRDSCGVPSYLCVTEYYSATTSNEISTETSL